MFFSKEKQKKRKDLEDWASLLFITRPDQAVIRTIANLHFSPELQEDKGLVQEMRSIALMMCNRRMNIYEVLRTKKDMHKDVKKALKSGLRRFNMHVP